MPPISLKVLKNDKRAAFQAASHAERAVTFLHGLQPLAETVGVENDDTAALRSFHVLTEA